MTAVDTDSFVTGSTAADDTKSLSGSSSGGENLSRSGWNLWNRLLRKDG